MNTSIKSILSLGLISSTLLLSACANTDIYGSNVYEGSQAKSAYSIAYGTIVSARAVKIQGESSGIIGSLGGGAIGGIAAGSLGGGRGSDILGALGSVAGAIIGNSIEQKADQVSSLEMVIRRDDGKEIVVVQKAESNLTVGTRVRIVGSGSDVTVSAL